MTSFHHGRQVWQHLSRSGAGWECFKVPLQWNCGSARLITEDSYDELLWLFSLVGGCRTEVLSFGILIFHWLLVSVTS